MWNWHAWVGAIFCSWSLTFNLLTFWEDIDFNVELWWCFLNLQLLMNFDWKFWWFYFGDIGCQGLPYVLIVDLLFEVVGCWLTLFWTYCDCFVKCMLQWWGILKCQLLVAIIFWLLNYFEMQIIVLLYFRVTCFFLIEYCWWSFF
jgi:hypothetical protein